MKKDDLKRNGEGYYDPTAYEAMKRVLKGENQMEYMKGEIYNYNMPNGDVRKVVIISSDDRANDRFLTMIALTEEPKGTISVPIVCQGKMYADCGMISYGDRNRFGEFVKRCYEEEEQKLNEGIALSLGLVSDTCDDNFLQKEVDAWMDKCAAATEKAKALKSELDRVTNSIGGILEENSELRKKLESIPSHTEKEIRLEAERDTFKRMYEEMLGKYIESQC